MPIFYVIIILLIYYFVKSIFKKKNEKMKLNELKKSLLSDEEVYRRKLEEDLGVDEKFRRKYGHIYKEPTYEYEGEGQLQKIKRRRKNSFLALVERLEKNINKGKIARSNCFSLVANIEQVIPKGNKKAYEIMRKVEDTLDLTLDELFYIKEEFLKYSDKDEYWDNYYKGCFENDYIDYEEGIISKEELEKRRLYYFGEE